MKLFLCQLYVLTLTVQSNSQNARLGKFQEVFAWRELSYNTDGNMATQDRYSLSDLGSVPRESLSDAIFFADDGDRKPSWNQRPTVPVPTTVNLNDESSRLFVAANNLPMGVERVGQRLFVTVPRRRYDATLAGCYVCQYAVSTVELLYPTGHKFYDRCDQPIASACLFVGYALDFCLCSDDVILYLTMKLHKVRRDSWGVPSTLNYIDLDVHRGARSPPLTPYPDLNQSRSLVSVYRTRADQCGRLWAVDTGAIEIPNNLRQIQPPAIVVFDLRTDKQILRYQLKSTDIPAANTPAGLASITVDVPNGDCSNAFAYIVDVATYGVIVYSLKENDSWRHMHNYLYFNPTAGNLRSAGQTFQWNDGVFSVALAGRQKDGCATAYFHPMVSTQEFAVSTCALQNRETNQTAFEIVGERGQNSQSTMHDYHESTNVMFFAEVGRDSISCWNTARSLSPSNMAVLAQDNTRLSYPADLHVTGDEVWVIANTLPRFVYSTLDPNEYNFYIYRANVRDLISNTVCEGPKPTKIVPEYNNYHN